MYELWNAALAAVNIPYTFLLGFVLLYWLSVILGAVDMGSADMDIDVDMDVDADVDADVHNELGGMASALHFFNFGKIPFMLIMTVVILSAWTMAIMSNHNWGNYEWPFALAMAGPIIFLSLLIAKFITTPFIPFFEQINKTSAPVEYVGQECLVRIAPMGDKFGQAEVRIEGDSLLIDVKTNKPNTPMPRGTKGVVVGKTPDKRFYLIEPLDE